MPGFGKKKTTEKTSRLAAIIAENKKEEERAKHVQLDEDDVELTAQEMMDTYESEQRSVSSASVRDNLRKRFTDDEKKCCCGCCHTRTCIGSILIVMLLLGIAVVLGLTVFKDFITDLFDTGG